MRKEFDVYNAKIMLLGEYSVIFDSMGLSVPYTHFRGELGFYSQDRYTDYDFAIRSNKMLKKYVDHLYDLIPQEKIDCQLDLEALLEDLTKGLYFESTIPQGYGLGSSGALVAAIYNAYSMDKITRRINISNRNITRLKTIFSQLESYFHGTSSGIDPLLCYLKSPILIKNKSEITITDIPTHKIATNRAIFLINTGKAGKTEPLVKQFIKQCEDPDFNALVHNVLIPLNNQCIHSLLEGRYRSFYANLHLLSDFQYNHFKAMIPKDFRMLWKEGLDHHKFKLKLCGSGGGGFLLGFSPNYKEAHDALSESNVEFITVYKKP